MAGTNNMLVALDIGGTLAKVVYFNHTPASSPLDFPYLDGVVHFVMKDSQDIQGIISLLQSLQFDSPQLHVAGGGAYKYSVELETQLNTQVVKVDEMDALHRGLTFAIKNGTSPTFEFDRERGLKEISTSEPSPALLVNIGTGVSILKLDDAFTRISGTCLGGGTLLGLGTCLLGVSKYEEILDLCEQGRSEAVDLHVSDIYGADFSNTLAVSLGKLVITENLDYRPADLARSLVNMVAYNIGQIAYLCAKKEEITNVYFAGNFIRHYEYIMDCLSYAMHFWSKGELRPLFLRHDGYFGALGSLQKLLEQSN
jgi:type II pantothenate kinase